MAKEIRTSQIWLTEIRLKMAIRTFCFVANARSTIKELVFLEQMYVFGVETKNLSPCFALAQTTCE